MEAWKIEMLYGSSELYHYGTKGMKWGERHWQNPDGTFNAAGKERYFSKGTGENYHAVKQTRSLKGNMHRLAAKNYALNEKTYAKSNPTLSSINKAAKEEALKKAAAADKAKADKLANKKQLTPEQKAKITKAAVGALAAAAVVGGTIYLAKTGKLDGVVSKGKEMAEKAISKGKNLAIAGKFTAKSYAESARRAASEAGYRINKAADSIKGQANYTKYRISNSNVAKEAHYAKYKIGEAANKGKNAVNRMVNSLTYKKRLREAEAYDKAAERRQRQLAEYAKESLKAFQDPNVLSYTRNDDSIGYHEHWEKRR